MSDALAYFTSALAHQTDPSDVYAAQRAGEKVVLVDVRSDAAWAQGRIPGAIHLPYRQIAEQAASRIPVDADVVVYCWGPGCNAGAKGAREFALAGYAVKEMIGGYEYWAREGQPLENDEGPIDRIVDPLTMVARPAQLTP